jgi:hypothetical protein
MGRTYFLILIGGTPDAQAFLKEQGTKTHSLFWWEKALTNEGFKYIVKYFKTLEEHYAYISALSDVVEYISDEPRNLAIVPHDLIIDSD